MHIHGAYERIPTPVRRLYDECIAPVRDRTAPILFSISSMVDKIKIWQLYNGITVMLRNVLEYRDRSRPSF